MDSKNLISLDAYTEEIWLKAYSSTLPTDIKLFSSTQSYLDIAPSSNTITLYLLDSITQTASSSQTTKPLFLYEMWSHYLVQFSGANNLFPSLKAFLNGKQICSISGTLQVNDFF